MIFFWKKKYKCLILYKNNRGLIVENEMSKYKIGFM